MEEYEFRQPKNSDEYAHAAFVEEFRATNEKIIPRPIDPNELTFAKWFKKITDEAQGINLAENRVQATAYFLVRRAGGKIVGAAHIRHILNDALLRHGGNIGYGVVPSERRKGFAAYMLSQALVKCRELGMERALITCDDNNVGSYKTIEKNGGVLENKTAEEDGNIIRRYWIELKD